MHSILKLMRHALIVGKSFPELCLHTQAGNFCSPPSSRRADLSQLITCRDCRYEGLSGHGYQAALSEEGFDVLLDSMGVQCEMFASPLNCRYANFCSAFPDVDVPFGSLGSFFQFQPMEGSFEANPPFVPEVCGICIVNLCTLLPCLACV